MVSYKNFQSFFLVLCQNMFFKAKKRKLSPGLKRVSGKGERLILIGVGGKDGWLKWDVIMRSVRKGWAIIKIFLYKLWNFSRVCKYIKWLFFYRNSMIYKDDMDSAKFEKFLHETCQLLREKYGDKVAIVMDNASYHSTLVRYSFHQFYFSLIFCYNIIIVFKAWWCAKIRLEIVSVKRFLWGKENHSITWKLKTTWSSCL